MSIAQLSTELLQKVYEYATIQDVIHLSMASKQLWKAFLGRKLVILQRAFYNSPYSPYPDLFKLVISGLPDTNRKLVGTEVRRRSVLNHCISVGAMPKLTLEFIQKMIQYGKIAEKWVELYPQLRWRFDSDERRVLKPHEAERLRRAIYQYWTYSNLFHDQDYCEWDPELPKPGWRHRDDLRFRLARTWATIDIVRQSEFVDKMRQLLEIELFPSNTTIQERHSRILPQKELAKYAWGDEQKHGALIDSLLKLNPAELLHLYQNSKTKSERLEYLRCKGNSWLDTSASWDSAVVWMASEERSVPGLPHPDFPSSVTSGRLEADQNVKFGVVDDHTATTTYFDRHIYAHDSSPTGEWVDPQNRPNFRSNGWLGEDDGDDSE